MEGWATDPSRTGMTGRIHCGTPCRSCVFVNWHRQVVDLVWCCQDWSVAIAARYKGYRYPIEVIGHAVWLYHRFALPRLSQKAASD
jgi:hypothetical protein